MFHFIIPEFNTIFFLEEGGWRLYHFLKPTQELKALRFDMAVAFMMFIKELRRNGGETAATAENHHLPTNLFCCHLSLN